MSWTEPRRATSPTRLRHPEALLGIDLIGVLVGVLVFFALLSWARADDNHYQNYLVGARAVGLGGAFTAIANDASAVFYNPAGLTQLQRSSVSLSAAIYGFAYDEIHLGDLDLLDNDDAASTSTFITYPTTAVWIQKIKEGAQGGQGRILAAFSLISPFSKVNRRRSAYQTLPQARDGTQSQSDEGIETWLVDDDTLWIGLSVAWRPIPRLHLGASVFFSLRSGIYQFYDISARSSFDSLPALTQIEGRSSRVAADLTHYGLIGLLGALFEISEGLTLGVTFRAPQLSLGSDVKVDVIVAERDAPGRPMNVQAARLGGDFNDRKPWHATLGLAYTQPRRFGVSVDLGIYGPVAAYHLLNLDGNIPLFPLAQRLLGQLNVGGEVYPLPWLALRAGFFTNLSSFEGPRSCADHDQDCQDRLNNPFGDAIDRYGVSGAVSYEIDRATITLAFAYDFGSATRATAPNLSESARRSFLFFVLGSSFRF